MTKQTATAPPPLLQQREQKVPAYHSVQHMHEENCEPLVQTKSAPATCACQDLKHKRDWQRAGGRRAGLPRYGEDTRPGCHPAVNKPCGMRHEVNAGARVLHHMECMHGVAVPSSRPAPPQCAQGAGAHSASRAPVHCPLGASVRVRLQHTTLAGSLILPAPAHMYLYLWYEQEGKPAGELKCHN